MFETVRARKIVEKTGSYPQFTFLFCGLCSLKCQNYTICLHFYADVSKNLRPLEHFNFNNLKDLRALQKWSGLKKSELSVLKY